MPRWIDMTDAARARVRAATLRGRDFDAELAALRAEAEAVKAAPMRPVIREMRLESLRRDYRNVLEARLTLETMS